MPADSRDIVLVQRRTAETAARAIRTLYPSSKVAGELEAALWPVTSAFVAAASSAPSPGEWDAPVASGEDPHEMFEAFVAEAIAKSPEPLQELGRFLADRLDEDDWKTADRLLLQLATHPTPATPAGLREVEGRFVAGPVWKESELTDEDGEPIWTSEVQTIGGYSVIATVHGGSEAEVIARRDAILAALQPQAEGGRR